MCNIPSPNTRRESNYVFTLRDSADTLEIQYNQQSGGIYIAEAQIHVTGEHINGGCYFDIDNVEDMDRLISYLTELRGKIKSHYDAALPLQQRIANGPYCRECGITLKFSTNTEIENTLCFVCEKKQILDKINPPFDDGEAGKKLRDILDKPFTICNVPVDDMPGLVEPEIKLCIVRNCGNVADPGCDYCFMHPDICDMPKPIVTGDFVCQQCGENFNSTRELKYHKCPTFA